tara:strand:- start:99 stop:881 length:783 start_codon:yes stop_codon:yes gene_type:complete
MNDCHKYGVHTNKKVVNENTIEDTIKGLSGNRMVNGIFVLHPFSDNQAFNHQIMRWINPLQDVEGLNPEWMGLLTHYVRSVADGPEKLIVPCTAKAVMKICEQYFHTDYLSTKYKKQAAYLRGKKAVVVNYTPVVGLPLFLMLRNEKATVTPADETAPPEYLRELMHQADILVTAVGKPGFQITGADVKSGSLVIDVAGDIDTGSVGKKADYVSRGGVGRVTRSMLLTNLDYLCKIQNYFKLGGEDPILSRCAREMKLIK